MDIVSALGLCTACTSCALYPEKAEGSCALCPQKAEGSCVLCPQKAEGHTGFAALLGAEIRELKRSSLQEEEFVLAYSSRVAQSL